MNWTCNNCLYRNTWDCYDGTKRKFNEKCENFKLDVDTLNERERESLDSIAEIFGQIMDK